MLTPHPSHRSLAYHTAILECHTPKSPKTCKMCGWPGSFDTLCTVCMDMLKILGDRMYWLTLESKERTARKLANGDNRAHEGF